MLEAKEGYSLLRQGLALNVKSHVSWHILGLYFRGERKHKEAIKCYQNALRIDSDKPQVLKDLSILQLQCRSLEGFQETRRQILLAKPSNKNNWIAFAIGNHLAGHLSKADNILTRYENTLTDEERKSESYENSEVILYRASILHESGQFRKALSLLQESKAGIRDKQSASELTGVLLLKSKDFNAAVPVYEALLNDQPENYLYHLGLREALRLNPPVGVPRSKNSCYDLPFVDVPAQASCYTADQVTALKSLYAELSKKYPQAASVRRLPLDFLSGDEFRQFLLEYMQKGLRKGVPSLFRDLVSLYQEKTKVAQFQELLNVFLTELRCNLRFQPSDPSGIEAPSALVWTLYFAGQHFDHIGEHSIALGLVEESIKHTPTFIDSYILKARILKHSGDEVGAFYAMDYARSLDLADRNLNTKCVRYAFRLGDPARANSLVGLFLKDSDKLLSLNDLQVCWYELAAGQCFERQGQFGRALKMYLSIEQHFEDIIEDQFDFHTYCLRKMTLTAYVRMIRWADSLRSHRFFFKAAQGAVRCYLSLHDKPEESTEDDPELAGLDPVERKKRAKALKRKNKKLSKEDEKEDGTSLIMRKGKENDLDPNGDALAATLHPLLEATRLIKLLQDNSPGNAQTHILSFEVYIRRGLFLLALRSLKRLSGLDSTLPDLHKMKIRFFHTVEMLKNKNSRVSNILAVERSEMGLNDLTQFNQDYRAKFSHSFPHQIAVAESFIFLDPSNIERAVSPLTPLLDGASHEEAFQACVFLQKAAPLFAVDFLRSCRSRFAYATCFMDEPTRIKHLAGFGAAVAADDAR